MLALTHYLSDTKDMESVERVMIVDGGGNARAQAIAHKLVAEGVEVVVSPGNPGNADIADSTGIGPLDIAGQLAAAEEYKIDLTVVGADNPLALGIVDQFEAAGQHIFGPKRYQARIEWDKEFAKEFARRRHIPVANSQQFTDGQRAFYYGERGPFPLFVKDNELALGKGVVRCDNPQQLKEAVRDLARTVIIEENIPGPEVSHHAFCDGKTALSIPFLVRDHKYAGDNDTGPMTGGMGAVGPLPGYSAEAVERLGQTFAEPVVSVSGFKGLLFTGLKGEPGQEKNLEWNARFGDPEAQVFLSLMKSDLLPVLVACVEGDLKSLSPLKWELGKAVVCLVIAAEGYPVEPRLDAEIEGLEAAAKVEGVQILHAGTRAAGGNIQVAGGRVLNVVSKAEDMRTAIKQAYDAATQINFAGQTPLMRGDIGQSVAGG
jgi:phosphoribosylamine--glycine ligase